jgi:hypothetical protein
MPSSVTPSRRSSAAQHSSAVANSPMLQMGGGESAAIGWGRGEQVLTTRGRGGEAGRRRPSGGRLAAGITGEGRVNHSRSAVSGRERIGGHPDVPEEVLDLPASVRGSEGGDGE